MPSANVIDLDRAGHTTTTIVCSDASGSRVNVEESRTVYSYHAAIAGYVVITDDTRPIVRPAADLREHSADPHLTAGWRSIWRVPVPTKPSRGGHAWVAIFHQRQMKAILYSTSLSHERVRSNRVILCNAALRACQSSSDFFWLKS